MALNGTRLLEAAIKTMRMKEIFSPKLSAHVFNLLAFVHTSKYLFLYL
jgi:hypothetical protein